MPNLTLVAILSLAMALGSGGVAATKSDGGAGAAPNGAVFQSDGDAQSPPALPQSSSLRWFLRKMGKRAAQGGDKCDANAACAMLQIQPGTTTYWTEEICSCGEEAGAACSLVWDEENADGKSLTNGDTQLKVSFWVQNPSVCDHVTYKPS